MEANGKLATKFVENFLNGCPFSTLDLNYEKPEVIKKNICNNYKLKNLNDNCPMKTVENGCMNGNVNGSLNGNLNGSCALSGNANGNNGNSNGSNQNANNKKATLTYGGYLMVNYRDTH